MLFGVGAVINGQVVVRVGIDRLVRIVFASAIAIAVLLLVVSIAGAGQPSFWIFMPMLGVLLAHFMFLMPNLNTGALEPMGAIAGTASSLTGAARIAGGAVLGAVVDSQVGDAVTPFAVATVIFIACAIIATAWAMAGNSVQDSVAD